MCFYFRSTPPAVVAVVVVPFEMIDFPHCYCFHRRRRRRRCRCWRLVLDHPLPNFRASRVCVGTTFPKSRMKRNVDGRGKPIIQIVHLSKLANTENTGWRTDEEHLEWGRNWAFKIQIVHLSKLANTENTARVDAAGATIKIERLHYTRK